MSRAEAVMHLFCAVILLPSSVESGKVSFRNVDYSSAVVVTGRYSQIDL